MMNDPTLANISWGICTLKFIFTLAFWFGGLYFSLEGLCLLLLGKRLVWPALMAWLEYKKRGGTVREEK